MATWCTGNHGTTRIGFVLAAWSDAATSVAKGTDERSYIEDVYGAFTVATNGEAICATFIARILTKWPDVMEFVVQATAQTTFFYYDIGLTQKDVDGKCRGVDASKHLDGTIPWEEVPGFDATQFDITVWMIYSDDGCGGLGDANQRTLTMTHVKSKDFERERTNCRQLASGVMTPTQYGPKAPHPNRCVDQREQKV
eukprot:1185815-Prorocentrum_minimum.AAC.3